MPRRVLFSVNIFRMPIGFHWSICLLLVWALYAIESPMKGILFFAGSITIVVVHELGHGAACLWRQYRVHRIVVHFLGGYCEHEAADYRRDQLAIALGGVVFQAFLITGTSVAIALIGMEHLTGPTSFLLLTVLVYYDLFLMAVNLIPFPGFDGNAVLEAFQTTSIRYGGNRAPRRRTAAVHESGRIEKGDIGRRTSRISRQEAKNISGEIWAKTVKEAEKLNPQD